MQEYRDGPIEEVAVHCARINRSTPTARGQHPICRARFHARSRNRDTNTAADPDSIEIKCCLEEKSLQQNPEDYKQVAERLTHRCGITLVDGRDFLPKTYDTLH